MQSYKIPLRIKIHPVVWEFYVCRYHTNTIELSPNDSFSYRIKYLLQLRPMDYNRNFGHKLPLGNAKILTLLLPKEFRLDTRTICTTYRNHLDDRRQYLISRELYNEFKKLFCEHIMAYCDGKNLKRGAQKKAIDNFCERHNIQLNEINYDMLKKTWDRSVQKRKIYKYINI